MATWNAHCRIPDGIYVTLEQHVTRSKERALALVSVGRLREAVASMMMDMRKHPNCEVPHEIHARSASMPPGLAMSPWCGPTSRVLIDAPLIQKRLSRRRGARQMRGLNAAPCRVLLCSSEIGAPGRSDVRQRPGFFQFM
jgi:hypothetical protein